MRSTRFCGGDIPTVRSNGNKDLIGRVMLVGATEENLSFSGFVIRIRVQSAAINRIFVPLHEIEKRSSSSACGGGGANISNLNQGILTSLPVMVPSAAKQREFVNSMNDLNVKIRHLMERAEAKLTDLATLRQALLQQEFSQAP